MTTFPRSFMAARLSLILVLVVCVANVKADEKRPFTVRDSVEMSYFGTVTDSNPEYSYDDGVASPDGRYFVKMTHKGVLPEGDMEGTIWLFDVKKVTLNVNTPETEVAEPIALVRVSAEINGYTADFIERGNILFQLMWSDDSRYLYFVARDGQENRQLFRVDVPTRSVEALSLRNQDVMTYMLAGESVAYLAGPNVVTEAEWLSAGPNIPDIVVGTGTPLLPLLYPNFRGYANTEQIEFEVWKSGTSGPEPIISSTNGAVVRIDSTLAAVGSSASSDGTHSLLTDELLSSTNWAAGRKNSVPRVEGSVHIAISETLNQPPILIATDLQSGRSRAIFDPNPQLSQVAMAEVKVFEWQDSQGRSIQGGLVTPPNFKPGEKYPLVIQTHGFHPDRFFRIGFSETANAGRPLAGRGIVVLQVEEPRPEKEPRWADLPNLGLDAYLAAIRKLAESSTIDPEKVGITGYSESGLFTASSLVDAPDRFAAAVIANSDPLTITGYFSYVDSPLHGVTERLLGAAPLGQDLPTWIERSPSMSTDKIQTPVLIFASDPWHLLGLWDFYAALRYQKKPVELHYIRTGRHNIKKPLHKLSHQEKLVDWFDFWLNANEDPNPKKAEQYRRWRVLKGSTE